MKIRITKDMSFDDITRYLYPVREYVKEKIDNNMYDDWDELNHTTKWIEKSLRSIKENNGDILDIYYLEDNEKIIGLIFSLSGDDNILKFLKENNIASQNNKIAQLSCFHIMKNYRGIGKKWLEEEIFKDLKEQGINTLYIKSSHNKALGLYDRLGQRVGNYIEVSDNNLYQRLGYIYKIEL